MEEIDFPIVSSLSSERTPLRSAGSIAASSDPYSPGSAGGVIGSGTCSLTGRIDSVDVMRGLTILAMAFVNDLADFAPVKDVPQWLKHMKAGVNGFTFVDMFILGMSIPLARGKRLAREGRSPVRVLGHVLTRGVSLIIIGLFDANRGAG